MDDSLKQKLSGLLTLLRNPDIKSKQAAFNACYEELAEAKELVSWEKIVELIKQETAIEFDARTASNMFGRTRKKNGEKSSPVATKQDENKKSSTAPEYTEEKNKPADAKKVSNPGELKRLRNKKIDLDDLTNGD